MQAQTALPQLLPAPVSFHCQPSLPTARKPPGLQSVAMTGSHNLGSWAQNLLLMVICSAFLCWCSRNTLFTAAHIARDPFIHQQTLGVEQGQEHRNTGTWCLIFRSARYLQPLLQLIETTSPVYLERWGQRRAAAQHIPGKAFAWWNFFHILIWQITRTESLKPWLWHFILSCCCERAQKIGQRGSSLKIHFITLHVQKYLFDSTLLQLSCAGADFKSTPDANRIVRHF